MPSQRCPGQNPLPPNENGPQRVAEGRSGGRPGEVPAELLRLVLAVCGLDQVAAEVH